MPAYHLTMIEDSDLQNVQLVTKLGSISTIASTSLRLLPFILPSLTCYILTGCYSISSQNIDFSFVSHTHLGIFF